MQQPLTNDNYRIFAATNYTNSSCSGTEEFNRDLLIPNKIASQIQKLINQDPKCNIRILINYVITFFNLFEHQAAKELLFFLVHAESRSGLKTILDCLNKIKDEEFIEIEECPFIRGILEKEFSI